jgi:putative PIN family toxin of toxin-antitoxin system
MAERAIRVFLDSNVILSGLLSEKGPPGVILDILSLGFSFLIGLTGRYNLVEIERNLKKKLPDLLPVYRKYLPRMNLKTVPLPKPEELKKFFGIIANKDVPVLVSAIESQADFLVTGDKQHFEKMKMTPSTPFKIVTPGEFLDLLGPEILKKIGKAGSED